MRRQILNKHKQNTVYSLQQQQKWTEIWKRILILLCEDKYIYIYIYSVCVYKYKSVCCCDHLCCYKDHHSLLWSIDYVSETLFKRLIISCSCSCWWDWNCCESQWDVSCVWRTWQQQVWRAGAPQRTWVVSNEQLWDYISTITKTREQSTDGHHDNNLRKK